MQSNYELISSFALLAVLLWSSLAWSADALLSGPENLPGTLGDPACAASLAYWGMAANEEPVPEQAPPLRGHVAAVKELRNRYLSCVNTERSMFGDRQVPIHDFDYINDEDSPARQDVDPQRRSPALVDGSSTQPVPRASLTPTRQVVVLDPGHGGKDPGAIGHAHTLEKDIVLEVARRIQQRLEASERYEVVMTRKDDTFVRLRDRIDLARHSEGELFVSLHADSLPEAPAVYGAAVYTLSERASNQEAASLAQKENRADILGGVDLTEHEELVRKILIDLAQRDANDHSIRLAEQMLEELDDVTRMALSRRQQAGFVVLRSPDMPSVLIELGYVSNGLDELRLADGSYQEQLAAAIADAIDRYFKNLILTQ